MLVVVEDIVDENEIKLIIFLVYIKRLLFLDRYILEKIFCYVFKYMYGNWVIYNMNLMDLDGNILIEV